MEVFKTQIYRVCHTAKMVVYYDPQPRLTDDDDTLTKNIYFLCRSDESAYGGIWGRWKYLVGNCEALVEQLAEWNVKNPKSISPQTMSKYKKRIKDKFCVRYPKDYFCPRYASTTVKPTTSTTIIPTPSATVAPTVLPVVSEEKTTSGSSTGLIIGAIAAVTVLCFLFIIIALYCKKKKSSSVKGPSGTTSGSGSKTSGSMSKSVNSTVKSPSKSSMSPASKTSKVSKMSKIDKKGKKEKTKMSQLKKTPGGGAKSQLADANDDLRSKNLYSTMNK